MKDPKNLLRIVRRTYNKYMKDTQKQLKTTQIKYCELVTLEILINVCCHFTFLGSIKDWFQIDGTILALHRLGNRRGDDERDLEAF